MWYSIRRFINTRFFNCYQSFGLRGLILHQWAPHITMNVCNVFWKKQETLVVIVLTILVTWMWRKLKKLTSSLTTEEIFEILKGVQDRNNEDMEPYKKETIIKWATISKIVNSTYNTIEKTVSSDPIMTRNLRYLHNAELLCSLMKNFSKIWNYQLN